MLVEEVVVRRENTVPGWQVIYGDE